MINPKKVITRFLIVCCQLTMKELSLLTKGKTLPIINIKSHAQGVKNCQPR